MAKKKVWKERAKIAEARERDRCRDVRDVEQVQEQLRDELGQVRTELVHARADNEELRAAGRCMFNATHGEIDPSLPVPLVQQIAVLAAAVEHAQEHWLEVDPR